MIYYNVFTNSSKKCSVSVGPGVASGWNWQALYGRRLCLMPSIELSFVFRSQTSHPGGRDFSFIAKPWFWLVM